jgi:ISPg7, transposase
LCSRYSFPCVSSELEHFRKRIREKGIELIFQVSIRINNEEENGVHYEVAFIDSTIQEKNITYPTNAKLHKSIVPKVLDIVNKLNLPLRQSYTFVLKKIYRDQHFHYHPIQNIRWLIISDLGNRIFSKNLGIFRKINLPVKLG